jgi:hypothetical protein
MNRKDWIWVAVKVFGVYLGIQALLALPPLVATYQAFLVQAKGFSIPLSSPLMIPLWQQAATLFILVNLSLYLLRSGRIVYQLIGRSLPPTLGDAPPAQEQPQRGG